MNSSVVQSVENCVCILRNLSYHVHKEIPGVERFQEPVANNLMKAVGQQKKKNEPDCFGGKRPKGLKGQVWLQIVSLRLGLMFGEQLLFLSSR